MSGEFHEKLRRLRKEGEAPAEVRAGVGLPSWWHARMAQRAASRAEPRDDPRDDPRDEPGDESAGTPPDAALRCVGPPSALEEHASDAGAFAARTTRLGDEHAHGELALRAVDSAERATFALLTGDAALADLDPRAALYLDIETTGLSGGAGTKAFLVGLGRFTPDGFELWQGFLRGPEEERALLVECAERIRAASGVVSFFGKSFDRHRLEDKMRVHGVRPPFDERAHFDLYHPCRRLWGPALVDTRLRTMERALCGVERDRDLPGAFAPAAWFDFLAGRPHLLEDVFRHNRDDVLSLVTLCARLGRALDEGRPQGGLDTARVRMEWSRCAGLAAVLARAKRWGECAAWAERAATLAPGEAQTATALELAGQAWRRAGCASEASAAFRRVADERRDPAAARASFELARLGDADAPRWLERAAELARVNAGSRDMTALLARCQRRLARAR